MEFVVGSFDGFELETNVLRHNVDQNGLTYIGRLVSLYSCFAICHKQISPWNQCAHVVMF